MEWGVGYKVHGWYFWAEVSGKRVTSDFYQTDKEAESAGQAFVSGAVNAHVAVRRFHA